MEAPRFESHEKIWELPPKIDSLMDLFNLVIDLAKTGQEFDENKPSEYLFHIMQVVVTSGALMQTMPEYDNLYSQITPIIYGLAHDIGRGIDMGPNHTYAGEAITQHLGLNDKVCRFTLDHHHFGLSIRQKLKEYILLKVNGMFSEDGPGFVKAILEGEKDTDLKKVLNPLIKFFIQRYDIAGATVLIADSSKIYTDKNNPFLPEIGLFNKRVAFELIKNQIDKGRYGINSNEALVEAVGTRFIFSLINYLTNKHGMIYEKAIMIAKERYEQYGEQLIKDKWSEMMH